MFNAYAWCCRFFNRRAVLASVIAKAFFSSYASPLTIRAQMSAPGGLTRSRSPGLARRPLPPDYKDVMVRSLYKAGGAMVSPSPVLPAQPESNA